MCNMRERATNFVLQYEVGTSDFRGWVKINAAIISPRKSRF
jgi:hypothetical protein